MGILKVWAGVAIKRKSIVKGKNDIRTDFCLKKRVFDGTNTNHISDSLFIFQIGIDMVNDSHGLSLGFIDQMVTRYYITGAGRHLALWETDHTMTDVKRFLS